LEGADTASGALQSAVLHLIAYPEVQKKAREELDRVIGPDRMPTVDDLRNLPYAMAFVNEVHSAVYHSLQLFRLIVGQSFPTCWPTRRSTCNGRGSCY
jgi:cytochrome P450